ncbi:MAG: phytoene/squalene synthase family protein [Lentilitoribacter sp.]
MTIDENLIFTHLREHDRHRFLSSLLMGDDVRLPISVIYSFNAEISRIRDLIKEPLPGEIRLQWWREVTAEAARKDEASANPLALAVNEVINHHNINRASFDGYCRSRIFDLYDDPMPDKLTYEGYCGETASTLLQWSCQIIDPDISKITANACGHAGIAQSVAGHLALLPQHISRGQVYIPNEFLKECDIDRAQFLSANDKEANAKVLNLFLDYGEEHLAKARDEITRLPDHMRQAFLPLAYTVRIYKKTRKMGAQACATSVAPATWLSQWDLWQSKRKGMI